MTEFTPRLRLVSDYVAYRITWCAAIQRCAFNPARLGIPSTRAGAVATSEVCLRLLSRRRDVGRTVLVNVEYVLPNPGYSPDSVPELLGCSHEGSRWRENWLMDYDEWLHRLEVA